MPHQQFFRTIAVFAALGALGTSPGCAHAQNLDALRQDIARARTGPGDSTDSSSTGEARGYHFKTRADSLAWARARAAAEHATGFRLVVSLQDFRLWAIVDADTVLSAPAAVAKGTTLEYAGKAWTFNTPRGVRRVLGKGADPVWTPPDWLYAETAAEHDLKLEKLVAGRPYKLLDGRSLVVRDSLVGVLDDGEFGELPTDEHIVFDHTLFIPPMGTKNRRVEGELGKFRLDLGEGYLLHGTPYKESIGMAATHGCIRLRDGDIEWLYDHIPIGTRVYIY
jgi:hypothetical protein